ncbi:MAG: CopD family protein [Gammaproteobacteria bacterium]|nr:CopD family protein [Gammaproteobacteria bacterium]MBT8152242.1 CopD family protein [Gammaproteobacteria bacterium]NND38064.1 CopD family protein [Pseudomonadales bacterium]NNM12635.1 CopD family protein [Pseudomonadales bacterium]RZV59209.1 MAG: CopD family protein [Pseudomonadales bacterium]
MLWLKAFHIIFVVCWFAGIFYLPRLFVYHAMSEHRETREMLSLMQRKLYRFVTPFAVLAIGLGLALTVFNPAYYWQAPWMWLKLLCVLLLVAYHIQCGRYIRELASGASVRSHVFFRWFNEAPVIALFAIVLLVVLRPLQG